MRNLRLASFLMSHIGRLSQLALTNASLVSPLGAPSGFDVRPSVSPLDAAALSGTATHGGVSWAGRFVIGLAGMCAQTMMSCTRTAAGVGIPARGRTVTENAGGSLVYWGLLAVLMCWCYPDGHSPSAAAPPVPPPRVQSIEASPDRLQFASPLQLSTFGRIQQTPITAKRHLAHAAMDSSPETPPTLDILTSDKWVPRTWRLLCVDVCGCVVRLRRNGAGGGCLTRNERWALVLS